MKERGSREQGFDRGGGDGRRRGGGGWSVTRSGISLTRHADNERKS